MTQPTHTPGPWTYESDHTHRQFNIRMLGHLIGTRDEAKHICTVNNLPAHVLANRDPDTAAANARLIAAAPDLLEAVKYAVSQYGQPGGPWNVPNDPGGWLERARAAIAKAEGK